MDPARISLQDDRHGLTGMAFRFGNRATYLGLSEGNHVWSVGILIGPEDELQTVSIDESGAKTPQILQPGDLFEALEILASDGPQSFSIAAALALTGLELRGEDEQRSHEFAALLRRAAADRSWPLPIRLAGEDRELHLSDQGRGVLRHLAEMLERDQRAMTTMPAARRLELAESALDSMRKRIQRPNLQAYRVQGRWYVVLGNLGADEAATQHELPQTEESPGRSTEERGREAAEEMAVEFEAVQAALRATDVVPRVEDATSHTLSDVDAAEVAGRDESAVDQPVAEANVDEEAASPPRAVVDVSRADADADEATDPSTHESQEAAPDDLVAPEDLSRGEGMPAADLPDQAAGAMEVGEPQPETPGYSEEELAATARLIGQTAPPEARIDRDVAAPEVSADAYPTQEDIPAEATAVNPLDVRIEAVSVPAVDTETDAGTGTGAGTEADTGTDSGMEADTTTWEREAEAATEPEEAPDEQMAASEMASTSPEERFEQPSAPPALPPFAESGDGTVIAYLRDEIGFLRGQLAEKDRQIAAWIEEGKRKDLMISRLESRILEMPGFDRGHDLEMAREQARQQLEAVRDEWLQPFVDQIRALENDVGRLEAERADRQASTLAEIRQERDTLRQRVEALETEIQTIRSRSGEHAAGAAIPEERRPWYRRLFGSRS